MTTAVLTRHARESMAIRQIADGDVVRALRHPMRIVKGNRPGRVVYEALADVGSPPLRALLRIVVDENRSPPAVITVYATTQFRRYGPVSTIWDSAVRVAYDGETDTLRITLQDVPVRKSEEESSGVILDYDSEGRLVALEILDASTRVDKVDSIQLHVTPSIEPSDAIA